MKHSLTSIAFGALLFSQSVLAGLYSAKDNVVELNQSNFQSEVMDSDVSAAASLALFMREMSL